MDFESLTELKQWFYKDLDNIAAFHFHLTNIILLLINDHREGEFHCFYNKVKRGCTLCKMHYDFSRDKNKGKEHLERFQHNHEELKKIADKMWPYLEEIFILEFFSLDFFNKEYHWFSRNRRLLIQLLNFTRNYRQQ